MKKLKWIVISLVAIVVAVIVAGVAILATFDPSQYREEIQAQAKEQTGRDLVLAGPMDLAISLTPAITMEDVTFANADWGSEPHMVSLDRLEVEVQLLPLLSNEIKVNRLVLVGANILLETDANGTPNWQFGGAGAAPESGAEAGEGGSGALPQISVVAIENSRLTYKDGVSGQTQVVGLDDIQLTESGDMLDVALNGSYQETPFDLSGSVGSAATLMGGGSYPVDLAGQVAGADISINGAIDQVMTDPAPDLAIQASGGSFADFNAMAGQELPDLGEYAFNGNLTKDGEAFTISGFEFTLAGNTVTGDLTADPSGAVPYVSASLAADTLDLSGLAGGEGGDAASEAGGGESPYVIPDTPLPLDGLRSANADLTVTIGKLILQENMEVDNIDLTLKLQGGRLDIAPLKALFSGGQIDLNTTLDASQETPALSTALNIAKLDYGQLMRTSGAGENVEGTADIAVNISGVGNSPRQIASTLNGSTELLGHEGVITNKLLALVLSGLGDVMGELLGGDDQAALNCLIGRFNIVDGNMSSQGLALNTDTFSVAGKGTVDLATESLNLYFDTATSQAAIASLAVPFTVTGTMKNPQVTPDVAGAALGAVGGAGNIGSALSGLTGGALGGDTSGGGGVDNPCVSATSATAEPAAEQPSALDSVVPEEVQGVTDSVGQDAGDAAKEIEEGIGNAVEGLFGN